MAKISSADYALWLATPDQPRVVVIALSYYEVLLGLVAREFVADRGYITRPTDYPPSQHALGIITQLPTYSRKLSDAYIGQVSLSFGDLEVDNSGGVRDHWTLRNWDGQQWQLWLASPDWAFNDFPDAQLEGVIEGISAPQSHRLRFRFRDTLYLLNKQMQPAVFTSGPNAGKPHPLVFGQPFNVEPVLEDATTYTYRVHDGQIGGFAGVREAGADVPFIADPAQGRFSLLASPGGRVTCDPLGSAPHGVVVDRAGVLIQHLACDYGGLPTAKLEVSSLATLDDQVTGPVGLWAPDRINCLQAVIDVATGVGGWVGPTRSGKLQVGRIDLTATDYAYSLSDSDVLQPRGQPPAMSLEQVIPPKRFTWIGYQRNWTPQTDGVLATVSQANRDRYGKEWLDLTTTITSPDGADARAHRLATDPQRFESLVQDAETAAQIDPPPSPLLQTVIITVTVKLIAFAWDIGRRLLFTSSRFGLALGRVFTIVGMDDDLNARTVTMRLLGTLPNGYTSYVADTVRRYLGLEGGGALLLEPGGGRIELQPS